MSSKIQAPSVLPSLFNLEQVDPKASVEQRKKVILERPLPQLLNAIFIGHVDAGKSTTIGRILFDTNRISPHLLEQYKKAAEAEGRGSFAFAWFMDTTAHQRKRGLTIGLSHCEWSTPKNRYYTLIDAPGHVDFIKNMITGTSQADVAVLVVDAKKGLVEGDVTQEHVFLAKASGVTSVLVALNKVNMIENVSERMQIINQRVTEISAVLQRCGFGPQNRMFCPINSLEGWNISNYDHIQKELPGWSGPCLIDAMDQIKIPEFNKDLPLRISIENAFGNISGAPLVVSGKLMSGVLVPDQKVIIKPSGVMGTVGSIEMHHKRLGFATQGSNVGISLKKVKPQQCTKASIISQPGDYVAKAVSSFVVKNGLIKKHPSMMTVGSNVIVHYQTGNACCEVVEISDVTNLITKQKTPGSVNAVGPNCIATVKFKCDKPIVVEPFHRHPRNSRVLWRDSNSTIGTGVVDSVQLHKNEI